MKWISFSELDYQSTLQTIGTTLICSTSGHLSEMLSFKMRLVHKRWCPSAWWWSSCFWVSSKLSSFWEFLTLWVQLWRCWPTSSTIWESSCFSTAFWSSFSLLWLEFLELETSISQEASKTLMKERLATQDRSTKWLGCLWATFWPLWECRWATSALTLQFFSTQLKTSSTGSLGS